MDTEFETLKNEYLKKKAQNEIEETKERLLYQSHTSMFRFVLASHPVTTYTQ